MTGLPQMWAPKKKVPEPDVPIEVQLWQETIEYAKRYQASAAANSASVRRMEVISISSVTRLAAEQYAYVRWLMGIDDYWLSIRKAIRPRPDHARLPHQTLDVRTPDTV